MTAIPVERKKTKDPFQVELNKAIALRKSRGLSVGISDSDESNKNEKSNSDSIEDNDDISEEIDDNYSDDYEDYDSSGDNSHSELVNEYLKPLPTKESKPSHLQPTNQNTFSNTLSSKDNFNSTSFLKSKQSLSQTLPRQKAIDEILSDDSEDKDDDDPLAFLLNKHAKSAKKSKVSEANVFESSSQNSTKKKVTFQPIASNLSPRSPTDHNLASRQQTPYKSKEPVNDSSSSLLDDLLADLKPRPSQRKLSSVDSDQIRPQPKARRRHGSNTSTLSEESQTRVAVRSPELDKVKEDESHEDEDKQNTINKSKSTFPSLEKPKRQDQFVESKITDRDDKDVTSTRKSLKISEASKREHQLSDDMSSSTEDLIARLEAASDTHPSSKNLDAKSEKRSSISNDISQSPTLSGLEGRKVKDISKGSDDTSAHDSPHSIQNDTFFIEGEKTESTRSSEMSIRPPSSTRRRNARKSPRTPPVNYQGLGSLHGLQQIRTLKDTNPNKLNSSANVRSAVYLQWLADREKKLVERKKIQRENEEKENEKKEKEKEEKVFEGESARRAWMKQKEEDLKKEAKKKRREEKRIEQEKMREEEEKRDSNKKADRVRQKYLKEARIRHKKEMQQKKEEEKILKEKEEEKKKENKEKLDKWMESRSKQWESERKKEIHEKKLKEKKTKEAKQEKLKSAEEKYAAWREAKEERERGGRRVNRHDEDKPPWSPANKVIPRIR